MSETVRVPVRDIYQLERGVLDIKTAVDVVAAEVASLKAERDRLRADKASLLASVETLTRENQTLRDDLAHNAITIKVGLEPYPGAHRQPCRHASEFCTICYPKE